MVLVSSLRPIQAFAVPVCNCRGHAGKLAGIGDQRSGAFTRGTPGKVAGLGDMCANYSVPHRQATVVYDLRTLRHLRVQRSGATCPGAHARRASLLDGNQLPSASLLDGNQLPHKRLKVTCPTGRGQAEPKEALRGLACFT